MGPPARFLVAVAAVAFATASSPIVWAADETAPSAPGNAGPAGRGRALLHLGKIADAERLAEAALQSDPDEFAWCLAGEVRLRRGDLDAAGRAFHSALASNPDNARALWGLGRIEQLQFHRAAAHELFAKAYQRDPRDADILLSYLDFVDDPACRATLLRNIAVLSRSAMPQRAEQAVARLAIEARLAGRPPDSLASPYTTYRLPLSGFRPSGASQHGLIVTARMDGTRPLRLILDTGARGILLHKSAARGLPLERVASSAVQGFGGGGAANSTLTLARRVAFDGLEFRDCLVEVADRDMTSGADGILGASLFERFRLRIDPQSRTLDLTPGEPGDPPDAPRTLALDRLLLVRAHIDGGSGGWFLLDTGAAYTSVSRALSAATLAPQAVGLNGMQGAAAALRLSPVSLRIGDKQLADLEPVALDLNAISQREGLEISGILGYSTLSRWPVTIDFRSGLVRIGDR